MPSLAPYPKFRALTAGSLTSAPFPLVFGKLYAYAAGTTTPKDTYTDEGGLTANTNPVILDARGEAPIWLGAGAYKLVLTDALGAQQVVADNIKGDDQLLLDAKAVVDQLRADLAAPTGPALIGYGIGTLADRLNQELVSVGFLTLQAAITAAAGKTLRITGTWTITAALIVLSNTEIILSPGAVVQTATPDISIFTATSQSNITIKGSGTIKSTAVGTAAYVAGVGYTSCTDCNVEDVSFVGMQWAGALYDKCTGGYVRGIKCSGWLGTVQDAADVCLYKTTTGVTVEGNHLYGGGHTGVLVQDPYTEERPTRNKVRGNWIGQHTAYAIAVYLPSVAAGVSYNEITGNVVRDIQGSFAGNRSSGAGIYIAGAGMGGTIVSDNQVSNCCVQTLDRTLGPAGISVNGQPAGNLKVQIVGNVVDQMTQGDGILITSCAGGVVIDSNPVRMPAVNDGTGPGGATLLGAGINLNASSGVTLNGVDVTHFGPGAGMSVFANGTDISDISLSGGKIVTVGGNPFAVVRLSTERINNLNISGLDLNTSSTTAAAMRLDGVTGGAIVGVIAYAPTLPALTHSNSTGVRYSACTFASGGSTSLTSAGTCTGSSMDKSNASSPATLLNAGTGLLIERYGTAAPSTGTSAVGDRVQNMVSTSGQPTGWQCKTAGSPGTWANEPNLT